MHPLKNRNVLAVLYMEGPRTVPELAQRLRADPDGLQFVLDLLTCHKLVLPEAERGPGGTIHLRYKITDFDTWYNPKLPIEIRRRALKAQVRRHFHLPLPLHRRHAA